MKTERGNRRIRIGTRAAFAALIATASALTFAAQPALDAKIIGDASGAKPAIAPDGVVKITWARDDVKVTVDGLPLAPPAGLGSWAAFAPMSGGNAMVMGDTVVFEDEVDAAMDAAFAHGLAVSALHNHFFYDTPKVYFMHIGGEGKPQTLASGVKAVWDSIKQVRSARAAPASGFGGEAPISGHIDAEALGKILNQKATDTNGVVKITVNRDGAMHDVPIGGSMGLTTWAAFSGSDALCAIDGDFIMTAEEVQPVLHALRNGGIHVVALHTHMTGEKPTFYFTHFWGKGKTEDLARALRAVLDAQAGVKKS
jgi:hypothetical protein